MKLPILQQSASSLRSLLKLGHLKCPQINFIPAFYSGYKGSALLDGPLVLLLQETAVRTWSFWTCHRWRWPVGEGISGCGSGSGRCTFLGLDSLAEDWERNGRGSFEGRAAPGPRPIRGQEGLQEDGRRRSAGASAMVTGHSLACSWVWPSPLLHPWLHPPHEVVTSNLGKGKEKEAALGRGRMTTLGPL